eukprot:4491794-Ditylum_brightwellii.AAC.1
MMKMRHEMHMEKQNTEKQSRRELQQHASDLKIKQQKEKEREKRKKEESEHNRRIKRARELQHNDCQQFQYGGGGYNLPSLCSMPIEDPMHMHMHGMVMHYYGVGGGFGVLVVEVRGIEVYPTHTQIIVTTVLRLRIKMRMTKAGKCWMK